MNIVFRVDASAQIGTGHFVRCLTLADALKQRGARIRFVGHEPPDHLLTMLHDRNYEFLPIAHGNPQKMDSSLPHAHWLGSSQDRDAAETLRALSGGPWDWLIVDHYAIDEQWESMVRKSGGRVAVIDDIADRPHNCDLLLDQNLHAGGEGRYEGKVPQHCRILSGPRYALLRDEFRAARELLKTRDGRVERILIFFGGVDSGNLTGRAIDAVAGLGIPGLKVDVVVGSRHSDGAQIAAQCLRHGFVCHVQTGRMAELCAAADLAIGAGGTAVWERCCLGLPALTFCVAQNQKEQIASAAREGLLYAPDPGDDSAALIQRHALALIENRLLRQAMSQAAIRAVDGRGASRVAGSLDCDDIEMRIAGRDDSRNLFEWRNDPAIRAVSSAGGLIDWRTHEKWLASVLNDADRRLLIGERGGSPVGVVRFDMKGDAAEISIYLVPGAWLPGLGTNLLRSAERWLAANRAEVCAIRAVILAGNERSRGLFAGAGYQIESTCFSKRLVRQ